MLWEGQQTFEGGRIWRRLGHRGAQGGRGPPVTVASWQPTTALTMAGHHRREAAAGGGGR